MNGNGEIPVFGFRSSGPPRDRKRDHESLDTAKRAAYTGGKGRKRRVIDFTGGAVKKKSRRNIFADVVERRKRRLRVSRLRLAIGERDLGLGLRLFFGRLTAATSHDQGNCQENAGKTHRSHRC